MVKRIESFVTVIPNDNIRGANPQPVSSALLMKDTNKISHNKYEVK